MADMAAEIRGIVAQVLGSTEMQALLKGMEDGQGAPVPPVSPASSPMSKAR